MGIWQKLGATRSELSTSQSTSRLESSVPKAVRGPWGAKHGATAGEQGRKTPALWHTASAKRVTKLRGSPKKALPEALSAHAARFSAWRPRRRCGPLAKEMQSRRSWPCASPWLVTPLPLAHTHCLQLPAPPTQLSKRNCGAPTSTKSAQRATSSSPSPLVRQGWGAGSATHRAGGPPLGSSYFLGHPRAYHIGRGARKTQKVPQSPPGVLPTAYSVGLLARDEAAQEISRRGR
jgi:hypothetical protein